MAKTTAQAVSEVHPAMRKKYDFSHAVYNGALVPMTGIICPEHGVFKQYPAQLRKNGAGCPSCGEVRRRASQRLSQAEAIAKAREKHGDTYDYSGTVYTKGADKITFGCPEHGLVSMTANLHIHAGRGCPRCGDARRGYVTSSEARGKGSRSKGLKHAAAFVDKARAVHGNAYDYSEVEYLLQKLPVVIICPKHGRFEQTPEKHLKRAQGCPECGQIRSRGEASIVKFMEPLADLLLRNRTVIKPKELDIYAPERKLAVEYCGEYWHGASSVEEEQKLKNRHLEKLRACEAQGIRLLTVYETEWQQRAPAIKRLIRNALGKGRGSVMARKCVLEKVGVAEAEKFFEEYHPQGGSGYGLHYGLRYGTKLVACMRFSFGANDRGAHAERVWTLSRYATRISVVGGASKLLAAFVADHSPGVVKSFSDNRYFTGAMYEKLGFVMEEESAPDYQVYHQKLGLMPKASWQRRKIPKRIRDLKSSETYNPLTDHRSERDMTFLLGAHRIFDCGKKRWVWRAPSL